MEYSADITEIGKRLQKRRKMFFKSQDEFAEALQIADRKTVGNWETGTVSIPINRLADICKLLDCDMDYLFGKIDIPKNSTCNVMKETGLSQTAVEKIIAWKNTDDYHRFWGDIISAIIESENAENLLSYIDQINGFSKWEARAANENNVNLALDMIDLQTSRLWYASKIFTDIIEDMSHKERMKEIEKNG